MVYVVKVNHQKNIRNIQDGEDISPRLSPMVTGPLGGRKDMWRNYNALVSLGGVVVPSAPTMGQGWTIT